MWSIGCSELHAQLDAVFETSADLAKALDRMTHLKTKHPSKHVWASGDFYAIEATQAASGEVGFVIRPTTDVDRKPPPATLPYSASELLELAAAGTEIRPAKEHCPNCDEVRRGRYANRDESRRPLFVCSTCEHWSETLPNIDRPGHRSRPSELAD